MTDQITVTPSQVVAAKMLVELADQLGESVSHLVRRIANATPAAKRSVGEVRSKQEGGAVPEFIPASADFIEDLPVAAQRSTRGGRYVTKGKGPKRVPEVPQASQRGRTRLSPAHAPR